MLPIILVQHDFRPCSLLYSRFSVIIAPSVDSNTNRQSSRDGGIGRRTGLKIPRRRLHGGSIPPPGTYYKSKKSLGALEKCVLMTSKTPLYITKNRLGIYYFQFCLPNFFLKMLENQVNEFFVNLYILETDEMH